MVHPMFERVRRGEYRTRDGRYIVQRRAGKLDVFRAFDEGGIELQCYRFTANSFKKARALVKPAAKNERSNQNEIY